MPRFALLLLMLMVAIPAATTTPVFADPRGYDFRDGGTYGDQDDNDDGPSDLYGQYGDDGDDDDDYGAYAPDGEFAPDDPSDGLRT